MKPCVHVVTKLFGELGDLRTTPQAILMLVAHIISETLILCVPACTSQNVDSLTREEYLLKIIKWV